jgi:hypothetical protein
MMEEGNDAAKTLERAGDDDNNNNNGGDSGGGGGGGDVKSDASDDAADSTEGGDVDVAAAMGAVSLATPAGVPGGTGLAGLPAPAHRLFFTLALPLPSYALRHVLASHSGAR